MTHIIAITGSDYVLSHIQRQTIIWNNADFLKIEPLGALVEFQSIATVFIHDIDFENIAGKPTTILSRPQCVTWHIVADQSESTSKYSLDNIDFHSYVPPVCDTSLKAAVQYVFMCSISIRWVYI